MFNIVVLVFVLYFKYSKDDCEICFMSFYIVEFDDRMWKDFFVF